MELITAMLIHRRLLDDPTKVNIAINHDPNTAFSDAIDTSSNDVSITSLKNL